jgi:UDP-MurNAc hydroxylase
MSLEFTVVGHAGLYITTDEISILVDPWVVGSAYWRSWWNYPAARYEPEHLTPDYVYLTHHHFDHFHYPSMRRIDRRTKILMARFGVDVMPRELEQLGFHNLIELPHGEPMILPGGTKVASYQYGFDDSAFLLQHDDVTLADFNDCKIRGRPLAPILKEFGNPTFLFKNHSWAQAYPNCYTADDPKDLEYLSADDYAEDFIVTANDLRPRYAVPFASMVCFLHPETLRFNSSMITPLQIGDAFAKASTHPNTGFEIMVPGDSWNSETGFTRSEQDPWSDVPARIAVMADEVKPTIEKQYAIEAATQLRFVDFHDYFMGFARSLPPGARWLFKAPIVFETQASSEPFWSVDLRKRKVSRSQHRPAAYANVIRMPDALLADSMEKKIVDFVNISMRLEVHVAAGGTRSDFLFWGLLSVHELGYLPLRKRFTRRTLSVLWRRRREFQELALRLVRRGPLIEKVLASQMASSEGTPSRRDDDQPDQASGPAGTIKH